MKDESEFGYRMCEETEIFFLLKKSSKIDILMKCSIK